MMRQLGYSLLLGLPRKGRWLSVMLGVSESQFDSGFYYRGTRIRANTTLSSTDVMFDSHFP